MNKLIILTLLSLIASTQPTLTMTPKFLAGLTQEERQKRLAKIIKMRETLEKYKDEFTSISQPSTVTQTRFTLREVYINTHPEAYESYLNSSQEDRDEIDRCYKDPRHKFTLAELYAETGSQISSKTAPMHSISAHLKPTTTVERLGNSGSYSKSWAAYADTRQWNDFADDRDLENTEHHEEYARSIKIALLHAQSLCCLTDEKQRISALKNILTAK